MGLGDLNQKICTNQVLIQCALQLRTLSSIYHNGLSEGLGYAHMFKSRYKSCEGAYDTILEHLHASEYKPDVKSLWQQSFNILNKEPFGDLKAKLGFVLILENALISICDRALKTAGNDKKSGPIIEEVFDECLTRIDGIKELLR